MSIVVLHPNTGCAIPTNAKNGQRDGDSEIAYHSSCAIKTSIRCAIARDPDSGRLGVPFEDRVRCLLADVGRSSKLQRS